MNIQFFFFHEEKNHRISQAKTFVHFILSSIFITNRLLKPSQEFTDNPQQFYPLKLTYPNAS